MTVYVAMGFHVENEQMSTINSRQFTDKSQAERQYHLYCAAACTSAWESDTAMLMTAEGFVIEQRTWHHDAAEPEDEPEEAGEN